MPLLAPAATGLMSALLELGGEPVRLLLRYDREALQSGEIWRLLSAHLVHLGPSHMFMNVAALAVLAVIFAPMLRGRDWLLAAGCSALAIDAGLFFFHPIIEWYVGLSGVLHGLWAAGCVLGLLQRRREAIPLAVLLVGKLAYEGLLGPLPMTSEIAAGSVVTQAHAWGAAGGALSALIPLAIRHLRASL
jgi:rhomboid family GlyGly-CTERM serine protease